MKSNRPAGTHKSPLRIPLGPPGSERLSAVAAFERWQRESPHAGTFVAPDDRPTDKSSRKSLKN